MKNEYFIFNLCFTGELEHILERLQKKVSEFYPEDVSHYYRPHCTVTKKFIATNTQIQSLIDAVQLFLKKHILRNEIYITPKQLIYEKDFLAIELEAQRLLFLLNAFIWSSKFNSKIPALNSAFSKSHPLHLTLAYKFNERSTVSMQQFLLEEIKQLALIEWRDVSLLLFKERPLQIGEIIHEWKLY